MVSIFCIYCPDTTRNVSVNLVDFLVAVTCVWPLLSHLTARSQSLFLFSASRFKSHNQVSRVSHLILNLNLWILTQATSIEVKTIRASDFGCEARNIEVTESSLVSTTIALPRYFFQQRIVSKEKFGEITSV